MSIQEFLQELWNGREGAGICETEYITAPPASVEDDLPLRKAQEDKLYRALCQRGRQILLYAPGGMGKTHMARKLFYRLHGKYKRMAWVCYGSGIRESLTMPQLDNTSDNPDVRFVDFIHALEEEPDTILFIDDAKESAVNDRVLAQLTGLGITILLTSRCKKIPPYESWEMETVTSRECAELFYAHYRKDPKRKYKFAVETLADRMERNVYAIRLLATVAGEPVELPQMAAALECGSLMDHIGQLMVFSGLTEGQREMLHCLSLMPNSEMPEELVSWFSFPAVGLEKLIEKGWLIHNKDANSLVLHDLLREYCNREEPNHRILKTFVTGALGENYNRGVAPHAPATFKGKILAFQTRAIDLMEKYWDSPMDLALACNIVGLQFYWFGNYRNALEYCCKSLKLQEEILSHNYLNLANTYNNVGGIYGALGNHALSKDYLLKGLAIREKELPEDHPDLAASYNNVGAIYNALGEHEKALEYQLKGLAICEKKLFNDPSNLATSYNNVGGTYGKLGNHEKSLEYLLLGLSIREKSLPSDHPDLANSYNNLGGIYRDLGDYTKALDYHLKCLTACEKSLPSNHPSLATFYNNLGDIYGKLGDYANALDYQLKSYSVWTKILPPNYSQMAWSCNNIAIAYKNMEQYKLALKWAHQAWDFAQHAFPDEHPARKNFHDLVKILEQNN